MRASGTETAARQGKLSSLADALADLPGRSLRIRHRRTVRGIGYLHVRARRRWRGLRVYCISDTDVYALVTSGRQLIRLDDGMTAAAGIIAAACDPAPGHQPADLPERASQPGTLDAAPCHPPAPHRPLSRRWAAVA
jgi:hypothetical protein